jgi:hypothetical protein
MTKKIAKQPRSGYPAVVAERLLTAARGGWIGGAGLGVADTASAVLAQQMDAYIKQ